MKKFYYTPSISVIEIEEAQIIAGSLDQKCFKQADQNVSSGNIEADAAGYRSNLWE
ncbi:MAG: hypothetical protein K6E73_07880 [Bacteroidales bacterium]|nr:hypothetical protein [Bacteroidales bacterium]